MRIAVWYNLPSGGAKRALYDHVRGLVGRGHEVEAWCPATADQSYLPLGGLIPEHVLPFDSRTKAAKTQLGHLVNAYRSVRDGLVQMDRHSRQCAAEINQGRFDLLFANTCRLYAAPWVGRYVNIPKLAFIQEPRRWLYEAMPTLPWAAPPARRWTPGHLFAAAKDLVKVQVLRTLVREEQLNARSYDMLLVNSFFSRESLLRSYGLDSSVCYLGVDTEKFVNQRQRREDYLIGVGAFNPTKNVRFILQALSLLPGRGLRLVWVGNDDYGLHLGELTRFAQDLSVSFEPKLRISDDELVQLLNRARAFVYAPRLEPFGYVPLEANACGLPVVAVAEGGIRETVIDRVNGLLVEPSPEAMASAIADLIDNPAYADRLGENGAKLVCERWALGAAIDRLEARFARLTERARIVPRRAQTSAATL